MADALNLEFRKRIQFPRGRVRFLLLGCIIITGVTCLGAGVQSYRSPQLSYTLAKLTLSIGMPSVAARFVDESGLSSDVIREVVKFAANESQANAATIATQSPSQYQTAATKQVIGRVLNATLPAIIQAIRHSHNQSHNDDPSISQSNQFFVLLPIILNIAPDHLKQWTESITHSPIAMSQCRILEARAACILEVHGPNHQTSSIILLWQRGTLLWTLIGVEGLSQLLNDIRRLH